ncbi:hypothetical protein E2C01_033368 [Portunus trituberculatus]|uniref:Endonuclease/exonuclease/phosphatase domain-containing protein n=1 Tax=Portunus trituberculatus TaxID=210409 RepID=A0A5B7F3V8_PORTR|nr:hypothetical protein [Portunus trituberculatus]
MTNLNPASESPSGEETKNAPSKFFYYLTSKVEHILSLYPFAKFFILGDFNVHHQLWLTSPFTDHPGELASNFTILHDLQQLVQHPTRIPDRLGDKPNMIPQREGASGILPLPEESDVETDPETSGYDGSGDEGDDSMPVPPPFPPPMPPPLPGKKN